MLSIVLFAALAQTPPLPFEALGNALLAAADEARGSAVGDARIATRLEALHERVSLGAVELWVPRRVVDVDGKLQDGPKPKEIAAEVAGLVALERAWFERVTGDKAKLAAANEALARITPSPAKARGFPLEAPDAEQTGARATLEQLFFDAPLGSGRRELVVVLAPTRAQFIALLGAGGIVYDTLREQYWIEAAREHVFHWLDFDVCIVAQSVAPDDAKAPALPGIAMFDEVATQWIVHGASHLLSVHFAANAPPWFNEALAVGDTISAAGADETLCSGAAPPATALDVGRTALVWVTKHASPYRGRASMKWFAKELKSARNREGLLVVDLARGVDAFRVSVPLLGASNALPALVDSAPLGAKQGFAELYRAYSTAFVHWLDESGASRERLLPRLMLELRALPKSTDFHALVQKLSERTLGASADPERDLEAAFAASLAR